MADVLMERGYIYHAMFIYNKPKLKNNRNKDQDFQVSFNVVKYAADKLASRGIRQTYYHDRDALPGSNIFSEFFDTVKASRYTVVVLTRGFLNDCWGKYKSQAAFFKLLDQDKSKRFIVLNIDLENEHIPDEFNITNSICFSDNWQLEDMEWERFINIFTGNVRQPVQDTGPDRFPVTYNNTGSDAFSNRRVTIQHPQASLQGNNLLAGLQETNPPNYPRANSIVETDAGPQEPPETTDNLHPENPNTTNRSGNGNPSNQQSGGGYQHSLGVSETQSEDRSVICQRSSTNGLNSNNSSSTSSSTTSSLLVENGQSSTQTSLQVENGQSSTQTGPGQTLSVTTPPTTVMSTTGNNIEEPAAQAVSSASTAMQNSGNRAQAVAAGSTTMQTVRTSDQTVASTSTIMQTVGTSDQTVDSTSTIMQTVGTSDQTVDSTSTIMHTSASREPPDGAATLTHSPPVHIHNYSDTNLKNVVSSDNGNENDLFSSLNRSDIEPDNNGRSISTDNQVSPDSQITETKNIQVCFQQTDHTKRSGCPKGGHSNSQHDSGCDQGLDLYSLASDHQDTNGSNNEFIGISRPNMNSAQMTNNSDGYESMDGPDTKTQGASVLSSTMKRMLPATRSTMKNTVGTMLKSMIFAQKCDQSFL